MFNLFFRYEDCTVYEIYPQSETPHLIQVAHLDIDSSVKLSVLVSGTVIWYNFYEYEDRIVFRVWDYRLNHSIKFSVDVDAIEFNNLEGYYFIFFQSPGIYF